MSKQAEYPPYDDRAIPVSDHSGKSKYGDVTLNSTCQNIALCNIDISLRRIADSIDIRKELDERTGECKKLTDELARMRVNCDMYADARDKAIAEKEALERANEDLKKRALAPEVVEHFKKLEEDYVRVCREKNQANDRIENRFHVGDVIAYRSLEPHKPEWVSWEVGEIGEDGFLYEARKSVEERDNIHKDCAFLVKAAEDNR